MSDKITIRICSFDKKSKSAGKLIHKPSIKKVIESDKFKANLSKGRVLSLLSHADRYAIENENIPMYDQVLISQYLAGYGKKAWIDEGKNAFMGEIELADNANGKLIKDMIKKGYDIGTSMSVSATADNDYYYVDDILSLGDFTLAPDLDAKILRVDFSQKNNVNGKNIVTFSQKIPNQDIEYDFSEDDEDEEDECECPTCGNKITNCSCGKTKKGGIRYEGNYSQVFDRTINAIDCDPKTDVAMMKPVSPVELGSDKRITNLDGIEGVSVESLNFNNAVTADLDPNASTETIYDGILPENRKSMGEIIDFPKTVAESFSELVDCHFSVRDYMRELTWPPHQVLRRRVDEVVQRCRAIKQSAIDKEANELKSYVDSYVLTWVKEALNSPEEFNIAMALRTSQYGLKSSDIMALNRAVKKMKKSVNSVGYMTPPIQKELNMTFQNFERGIYKYIDDKIGKDKKFPLDVDGTTAAV